MEAGKNPSRPDPTGQDLLNWLKGPLKKFGIVISPHIRKEKFRFRTIILDPADPAIFGITKAGVATDDPAKSGYTVSWQAFTIQFFPTTRRLIFTPSFLKHEVVRQLGLFLTEPLDANPPGCGCTGDYAIQMFKKLVLWKEEDESEVEYDPLNTLPFGRIGVTHFDPVPHFGPATLDHFVDKSKNPKEFGVDGDYREANDYQEIIARPARVVGFLRGNASAIVDLGLKFNALNQNYSTYTVQLLQQHKDEQKRLDEIYRVLSLQDKDITALLKQSPDWDVNKVVEAIDRNFAGLQRVNTAGFDGLKLGQQDIVNEIRFQTQERQVSDADNKELLKELTKEVNGIKTQQIKQHNQVLFHLYQNKVDHKFQDVKLDAISKQVNQLQITIDSLASALDLHHQAVITEIAKWKGEFQTIHEQVEEVRYKISDKMQGIYAAILLVLSQKPKATAKQLNRMLGL